MSNTFIIHDARLVDDAEIATLPSGDTVTTLRLADNPPHAKDELRPARFVRAKIWGKLGESAGKLSKGDVISVSGQLSIEVNRNDDTKRYDVMRVDSIRVQKSDSYFGRDKGEDRPPESGAKGQTGQTGKGKGRVEKDPFAG